MKTPCPIRYLARAVVLALVAATVVLAAQPPGAPERSAAQRPVEPEEVRAVWVTRWDYKTESDVRRAVRWSAAVGLNRIFFQVRGRADAFYRSAIEPWGEEIGGRDPGFDPLATAIDEAQKVGVELHAWVNLLPAWKGSSPPKSRDHILHRRPDWFLLDSRGRRLLTSASDYTILNPCLPEVRSYLAAVLTDIASRYAIDGVQLDYARFVARDPVREGDFPHDPHTLAIFRRRFGGTPATQPESWDRFRRMAVNTAVYEASQAVTRTRPGCEVSAAAIANYDRARTALFQDAVTWQSSGWVQAVYPMTYTPDSNVFSGQVGAILRQSSGTVIPGIGVYLHRQVEPTIRQIDAARQLGSSGYCLFAFASIFPSPSHEYRDDVAAKDLHSQLRRALVVANSGPPTRSRPDAGRPDGGSPRSDRPDARMAARLADPPPRRR